MLELHDFYVDILSLAQKTWSSSLRHVQFFLHPFPLMHFCQIQTTGSHTFTFGPASAQVDPKSLSAAMQPQAMGVDEELEEAAAAVREQVCLRFCTGS